MALHQYTLPDEVAEIPRSKEISFQVKIMKHLRDKTNKKGRVKLNYTSPLKQNH